MNAEALLVECEPLVRQMAYSRAWRSNRPDLELDLAQAARIGLWQHAADAPTEDLHRIKWAATVIRARMVDLLRDEIGRRGTSQYDARLVPLDEAPEAWLPCEAVSLLAVRRLLAAIAGLPPRRRALIEGLAEGREQREVGAELGVCGVTTWKDRRWLREWVRRQL